MIVRSGSKQTGIWVSSERRFIPEPESFADTTPDRTPDTQHEFVEGARCTESRVQQSPVDPGKKWEISTGGGYPSQVLPS